MRWPSRSALEKRGYKALWTPESRGRNVLVNAAWLLAGTSSLVIATGIANIYARDAMATANAQRGLNEQSGNRFLLGLGVSHKPLVSTMRGHAYGKPVATMRAYLEAMRAAPYQAPPPSERPGPCSPRSGRRCWRSRQRWPTARIPIA